MVHHWVVHLALAAAGRAAAHQPLAGQDLQAAALLDLALLEVEAGLGSGKNKMSKIKSESVFPASQEGVFSTPTSCMYFSNH